LGNIKKKKKKKKLITHPPSHMGWGPCDVGHTPCERVGM